MDELRLTLVTDRTQTRGRELVSVVGDCLAAGLPAVQVREKDLGAAELAVLCRRIRGLTQDTRAFLIVNDRVDVALAVGADGVQRSSTSLTVEDIRAIADKRLRIGASIHSLPDALQAELEGADWLVFGPVYDTPSKRMYGPPQGLDKLARVAAAVRIPVVAIGGLTPERVREVRRAGARGVAVVSSILAADSPADATRRFLEALAAA
ncbi:MAG: thiamine phosphate synthase [Candidatus Rokuibacteriota bacterium]|nr:MAG: thiamine phosphate synthase [Candidatus Rokubacteria bacterium]